MPDPTPPASPTTEAKNMSDDGKQTWTVAVPSVRDPLRSALDDNDAALAAARQEIADLKAEVERLESDLAATRKSHGDLAREIKAVLALENWPEFDDMPFPEAVGELIHNALAVKDLEIERLNEQLDGTECSHEDEEASHQETLQMLDQAKADRDAARTALTKREDRVVELEKAIGVCVPSILRCYLKTADCEADRETVEKVLARVNAAMEYGKLLSEQPARTRCSCSFSHPPHDWCDGNPNAEKPCV